MQAQRPPATPSVSFLYGTAWKEDRTRGLVLQALEAGFRGIDTANQRKHYHEAGVGEAIAQAFAAGLVSRDDLFLQTKFTFVAGQDRRLPYDPNARIADQVRQSFASSLEHLGVERIDSYVLHGPMLRSGLHAADLEAWGAMEEVHASGRVRALGISNVGIDQLEQICARATVAPSFVQNRCHAQLGWDRDIRSLCSERGITYQGFSLLTANAMVVGHPEVARIAHRHACTAAQVVFAFARKVGMLPLTGTTDPAHVSEALASLDFELDAADVKLIDRLAER